MNPSHSGNLPIVMLNLVKKRKKLGKGKGKRKPTFQEFEVEVKFAGVVR